MAGRPCPCAKPGKRVDLQSALRAPEPFPSPDDPAIALIVAAFEGAFRRLDLDQDGRPQVASIDRLLELAEILEPDERELVEALLREIHAGHRRGTGEHYEDEEERRREKGKGS